MILHNITSAKITTFKNALNKGFEFEKVSAQYAEDYGWIFHAPKQSDIVVEYHFVDNDESSEEQGTVLFGGETSSLYFVAAKCSCGCEFAQEYMMDDLSALSHVLCPDCGAETQEVDDSLEWNRTMRQNKKAKR